MMTEADGRMVERAHYEVIPSSHGPSATFRCPHCGGAISLTGYRILPTGEVNPVVCCPADRCRFVANIHLCGWCGGLSG